MTSPHTHRGRVYRRCACRHAGKQLGAHCPELTSNARHGTWTSPSTSPTSPANAPPCAAAATPPAKPRPPH
jgi:hypothetical protein